MPELKPQDGNRTLLVLHYPRTRAETHILIDTARKVALWIEGRHDGKVNLTTRYDDFVEVGGAWYAGREETFDAENRRTSVVVEKFQALGAGQWEPLWKGQLAAAAQVQFLHEPLPSLLDAKKALAAGKASFEDQVVMALHFERSQQWARVMDHWQRAEQSAAAKPGLRWVRYALLNVSRRREELRTRAMEEAAELADTPAAASLRLDDQLFLAEHLMGQSGRKRGQRDVGFAGRTQAGHRARPGPRLRHEDLARSPRRLPAIDRPVGQVPRPAPAIGRAVPARLQRPAAVRPRLADARDYDAAYAWIAKVVAAGARWLPYEEELLRNVVSDFMRQQGRYPELVDYLAGWLKLNPESESPYRQYLGALVFSDRLEEADSTAARWLAEGQTPQKLTPDATARLRASIYYAVGQGYNYNYNRNRMDPQWFKPLAEAVLVLARHDKELDVARQIMGHNQFTGSDECRRVRKSIARILRDDFASRTGVSPVLSLDQIRAFIDWISPNDPAVEPELWHEIAAGLRQRWSAEVDQDKKNQVAGILVGVLSGHATPAELLEFLRAQVERAPQEYRAGYARQLFNALLNQPWSAEYENEALSLLEQLSDAEEPAQRLAAQVAALYGMTDRMVRARFDARMKTIEHQEKLTRTELAAKRAENLKAAREGFADRLRDEARRRQPPLSRWMTIERVYLDVVLGRNLDQAEGECWELWTGVQGSGFRVQGSGFRAAVSPVPSPQPPVPSPLAESLDDALRSRCLVTLLNLAARKTAKPASVDRLLAYLDKAIAADAADIRFRLFKTQLLIAIDRPKDLQQSLEAWVKAGDADNRWRQALAYLLAEQGRLEQAIELFEAIRASDELGPTDYRTLADWYMAVGPQGRLPPGHDCGL